MKISIKEIDRLAAVVPHIRNLNDQARVSAELGRIIQETRPDTFDWLIWNRACRLGEDE